MTFTQDRQLKATVRGQDILSCTSHAQPTRHMLHITCTDAAQRPDEEARRFEWEDMEQLFGNRQHLPKKSNIVRISKTWRALEMYSQKLIHLKCILL